MTKQMLYYENVVPVMGQSRPGQDGDMTVFSAARAGRTSNLGSRLSRAILLSVCVTAATGSGRADSEEVPHAMSSSIKIDYVEFQARDLEATKSFFRQAFGWEFVDYGPDYSSFSDQGVNGGFYRADGAASVASGSALVILYSDALEDTAERVRTAGGIIIKEIFSFPGGRRFHFREPSGNELAVWSDKGGD